MPAACGKVKWSGRIKMNDNVTIGKIKNSFAIQAKNFENSSMNFSKQEYLDYTVNLIGLDRTDAVLEVAAGTCACGRAIAPNVSEVICIDATPALFLNHSMKLSIRESTPIRVGLLPWMELTKTPAEIREEILKLMETELDGGDKTGFEPYREEGQICFNQRWLFMMGIKE